MALEQAKVKFGSKRMEYYIDMIKNAKSFNSFISLLALFALLCSCETRLLVDKEIIETDSSAKTATIKLDVNKEWTAKSSAEHWCTISPKEGNKDIKSITVSVISNDTYSDRECTITIVSKDKSISIAVKQDQNDGLFLETNKISISDEEQDFDVIVTSNVEFRVSCFDDWITSTETKALSNSTLTFHTAANTDMESRSGRIRIAQVKGLQPYEDIIITQKPRDSVIITLDTLAFSWENAKTKVDTKANIEFAVTVPEEYYWLHTQVFGNYKANGYINVSADDYILTPYDHWDASKPYREGKIIIEYGTRCKEIVVTQTYKEYIWISQRELNLYVGSTSSLSASVFCHDVTNKNLIWTSNDETVVTVDNNGTITGLQRGKATVTVRDEDNRFSASCIVTVKTLIDDIIITATGYYFIQRSNYCDLYFHSKISFPYGFKYAKINSVWLCYPDGTAYSIQSASSNGYSQFYVRWGQSTFNQWDIDYFCKWYVLYQVEIDGKQYNLRQNINAYVWAPL